MAGSSPMLVLLFVLLSLTSPLSKCSASFVGKDESPAYSGHETAPNTGIACSGNFCDNKRHVVVGDGIAAPVHNSAIPSRFSLLGKTVTRMAKKDVVGDSYKFAPIYFFDRKASENCFPDWPSSANNKKCRHTLHPSPPVFVKYDICDSFEVYTFWVWYGLQKGCIIFDPGHDNDGEKVSVFVKHGRVQKVTFYQHRARYTRRRGTFGMEGERPYVYVGKVSHGSYHAHCNGKCPPKLFFTKGCLGSVNYCQGGCGYWDDFRNPGPRLDRYTVHDLQPGAKIDGIQRPNINACVSSCGGAKARVLHTSGCWQNNV